MLVPMMIIASWLLTPGPMWYLLTRVWMVGEHGVEYIMVLCGSVAHLFHIEVMGEFGN